MRIGGNIRGKEGNHVQKSCTKNDKKANPLAFREFYVPYHVHGKHENVNIGNGVRKTMDKERNFGVPAGSTGRIPISRYRVALLIHLLTFLISLLFAFATCIGVEVGRKGGLTNTTTLVNTTPQTVMHAMLAQMIRR